jgi:hypothetical protein
LIDPLKTAEGTGGAPTCFFTLIVGLAGTGDWTRDTCLRGRQL